MTWVLPNRLTMFLRFKPAIAENSTYQRQFRGARDENIRDFFETSTRFVGLADEV
jgi:hypothetical protein